MTDVADALGMIQRGWSVFPAELRDGKKVPIGELVEHGFKDASAHPRRVGLWWKVRPEALIGVAMPPQTVALDVDAPDAFAAAGLDLPDGPGQPTPRGGYHRLFRTDGRKVRQTVKEVPGSDTRVGGLGYLIAWHPELFPEVSSLPMAPEWLYDHDQGNGRDQDSPIEVRRVGKRRTVEVVTFEVGERDDKLASLAGAMRAKGAGPDAIYAAFAAMLAGKQIKNPPDNRITDKDLRRIANSIGTRQSDAVDQEKRPPAQLYSADELYEKSLRDLEYPIADIFPEGLGIVAGAPKVGKSWLTFQAAIQIAAGASLLGKGVDKSRPVLYYGLEDGERRFQKRMKAIISALHPNLNKKQVLDLLSSLALRYEASAIGGGLEDDVARFIDDNGGDAVVFIDVLAKIRPPSRGKGSAYDEDYAVLGPLQSVSKERPGSSIVVVTHDRKMGSEDFLTTVTGTRGVTGSADWIWVVKRPRLEDVGTIYVTGRDIERDAAITAKFDGVWSLVARLTPPSLSGPARDVWAAIEAHKPCDLNAIVDVVHGDVTQDPNRANHVNSVFKLIAAMEVKGYVKQIADHKPYLYVTLTNEDLVSSHAGGLVPVITHSTAASRARGASAGVTGARVSFADDADEAE